MSKADVDLLKAAVCVAGLDGEITDDETEVLIHLAHRAGVHDDHLTDLMAKARIDNELLNEQLSVVRADPEVTIGVLCHVAAVDGEVSGDERAVIHQFGVLLGISRDRMAEIFETVAGER